MYKPFLAIIVLVVIPILPGRASLSGLTLRVKLPVALDLEPTPGRVLDPPLVTGPVPVLLVLHSAVWLFSLHNKILYYAIFF